jgi:hypothetical protein
MQISNFLSPAKEFYDKREPLELVVRDNETDRCFAEHAEPDFTIDIKKGCAKELNKVKLPFTKSRKL